MSDELDREVTIDVRSCARCGGEHYAIRFVLVDRPIDGLFQYWAPCPADGAPILARTLPRSRTAAIEHE